MAVGDPRSAPAEGLVLVVDDDPAILESVRWVLADEGFRVITASDGEQAYERAVAERPAVLVLDMGLPLMQGDEVALRLRAELGEHPAIVVMTADGRARERARRIGAVAYFNKPFELDHLVAAVRRALAERASASASDAAAPGLAEPAAPA